MSVHRFAHGSGDAGTRQSSLRRLTPLLIAGAALMGGGLPAASADGVDTAAGHAAEDTVVHAAADERSLGAATSRATAVDASDAAAAVAGDEGTVGSWGPLKAWPVVGVHVALMPNGKVLAYDSVGENATETYQDQTYSRATVWDPGSEAFVDVRVDTGFNVFCSGLAHLTDGRVFLAGGNKDTALHGIRQTHVFDGATNSWSRNGDMASERWYPTVTAQPNGEMLISSGQYQNATDTPEVRKLDGTIRSLSTARDQMALYPWMDVAPDGSTFNSGPETSLHTLSTSGTGSYSYVRERDSIYRDYGSHALYDKGKILVAGGGPSTRDSRVIDLNGASPTVTQTGSMGIGRRQHNLTVLADGSVLATGGNSSGANLVDLNNGVYNAERWNPATGQWQTLAAMGATRQYHSSALLLPDGRVLSSGGGICSTCDQVQYLAKNAQVFSPPYLFKADGSPAPRPTITSAPAATGYDAAFDIGTPDAASVRKVGLIRLGAVTHSVDMEQRYVPLSFSTSGTTVTARSPLNANLAPPGYYMLVVVDASGVPSVSRMVRVAAGATPPANVPPTVTLDQPAAGSSSTAPATISFAATAADSDGSVAKVEFYAGATKVGEDLTAPYTFSWSGVGAGSYSVKARAVDNAGAATETAARGITVVASTNKAPTVSLTAPANGTTLAAPATVTFGATAADTDGSVARVEFWAGFTKVGEDTTAPYTTTWSGIAPGSYGLWARALDDKGAATTTPGVLLTVTNPSNAAPTISLTRPLNGTRLTAPATVSFAATAADRDGSVAKVEFFNGYYKIGEDTTAPYSFNWGGVPAGSWWVWARAIDNRGAVSSTPSVTVTVVPSTAAAASSVLRSVAVVGSTATSRRLQLTATRRTSLKVTLAKRGRRGWDPLPGRRVARVRPGRSSLSLRDPWAGRRLKKGRYRVSVQADKRVVHRSFLVL